MVTVTTGTDDGDPPGGRHRVLRGLGGVVPPHWLPWRPTVWDLPAGGEPKRGGNWISVTA